MMVRYINKRYTSTYSFGRMSKLRFLENLNKPLSVGLDYLVLQSLNKLRFLFEFSKSITVRKMLKKIKNNSKKKVLKIAKSTIHILKCVCVHVSRVMYSGLMFFKKLGHLKRNGSSGKILRFRPLYIIAYNHVHTHKKHYTLLPTMPTINCLQCLQLCIDIFAYNYVQWSNEVSC